MMMVECSVNMTVTIVTSCLKIFSEFLAKKFSSMDSKQFFAGMLWGCSLFFRVGCTSKSLPDIET